MRDYRIALPFCALVALSPCAGFAQTAQGESAELDEVVVTGSRIARRDYVAASPITTVQAETLQASGGITVEAGLNQLPQFAASAGSSSNLVNRGGQASANLRNLGPMRTLVLLDGRRVQPANPDGSVDLNIIPDALIDSVEVITGGASSTYGSDAIAGVVNFKLKRNFEGLVIDSRFGQTSRGDGATQTVSVLLGGNFADDRGNATLAASYANREGILYPSRDFFRPTQLSSALPQGTLRLDAANLPTQAAVNTIFGRYGVAPGTVARTRTFGFNTDGTLFVVSPIINYRDPPDHTFDNNGTLQYATGDFGFLRLPLTRYSTFGKVSYDITEHLTAYAEASYTTYQADTQIAGAVLGGSGAAPVLVPLTNPFIPADLRELAASRPNATAPLSIQRRMNEAGQRTQENHYDVHQITLGLEGRLPISDWTWNLYGTRGVTDYLMVETGYPSLSATNTLLNAPGGGTGICAGGYDPFGLSELSPACQAYLRRDARSETKVTQEVVEANVQGGLWSLPAGQLRFAAGADYRRNTFKFSPDALIVIEDLVNRDATNPSEGSDDVYELYGELLVPLIRDVPFIEEANVSLGYRFSDYASVGAVHTYKADVDWRIIPSLRMRAGYSRAIRAPSVGELYAAGSEGRFALGNPGTLGSGDPCDVRGAYRRPGFANQAQVTALCLAQGIPTNLIGIFQDTNPRIITISAGNPQLNEESSDTYSAGLVWRPEFEMPLISGLAVSVDYYSIEVTDAIGNVSTQIALNKCYNDDGSNPSYSASNFYCALITRDPTSGLIDTVVNPSLNLGGFKTSGIDVQLDWAFQPQDIGLPDIGDLRANVIVNYLDEFLISTLPGTPFLNYAGTNGNGQIDPLSTARPEWKLASSLTYTVGDFMFTTRYRYISSMTSAGNVGTSATNPGVDAVDYVDFDARWSLNSKIELRAGVVNLTDNDPPQVGTTIGATNLSTYDLEGRRFYVGVRASF